MAAAIVLVVLMFITLNPRFIHIVICETNHADISIVEIVHNLLRLYRTLRYVRV